MAENINKTLDKIGLLFTMKKNQIQESKVTENPAPPQPQYSVPPQMIQEQQDEDKAEKNILKDKIKQAKQKEHKHQKRKEIKAEKLEQKHQQKQLSNPHGPVNKSVKNVRKAAGQVWIDNSMSDWPDNDYRLFIGNLGNEVTDTVLANAFRKFSSFQRARVIRCKRSMKTKGYGFVSLYDPNDYLRAFKEMNGKYVGNRPCKIVKSKWSDRCSDGTTKEVNVEGIHSQFKKPPKIKKQKVKGFTTYAVDQVPLGGFT